MLQLGALSIGKLAAGLRQELWRMQWRVRSHRKVCAPMPSLAFVELASQQDYLRHVADSVVSPLEHEQQLVPAEPKAFVVQGYCQVCCRQTGFFVDFLYASESDGVLKPNWRERMVCAYCGLNNRMRAAIHLFDTQCRPRADDRIYMTEQTTKVYRFLSSKHPGVVGSEHLGDSVPRGQTGAGGLRNEDLTQLTFADASLDHILSFDVLEHIPDYRQALHECFRSLKPGGTLLFSVPFLRDASANLVRSRVNQAGEIEHLLPPEYHGDPLRTEGCLCFYHFGWQLLDELRIIGFEGVKAIVYWAPEYGYLGGEQIQFLARKPLPAGVVPHIRHSP